MMAHRLRPPISVAAAASSADDSSTHLLPQEAGRNDKNALPVSISRSRGKSGKFGSNTARARMYTRLCTPFLEEEDRIGVRRSGCMSSLGVRLAILVPFLVSVSFATAIFLCRAEIQNGLMPRVPRVNQWGAVEAEGEPADGYGVTSGNYYDDDYSLAAPEPAAEAEAEGTYDDDDTGTDSEAESDAVGSGPSSTTIAESENAAPDATNTMPEAEPEAPSGVEPEPIIGPTESTTASSPAAEGEPDADDADAESEYGIYGGDSNSEPGVEGKDGATSSTAEAGPNTEAEAEAESEAEAEAEAVVVPEAEAEAKAVVVPEAAKAEVEAEAEAEAVVVPEAEAEAEAEAVVVPEAEAEAEAEAGSQSASISASMPEAEPEAPAAAVPPVQSAQTARKNSPVPRRGLVSKSGNTALLGDPTSESEPAHFEINDTISSFVGNMGLVFGLIYAFVFGRSYARFDCIMSTFYGEVAAMHKLVLLVQTVQLPEKVVNNMIEFLKHYANQCRYEVVSSIMLSDSEDAEVMTKLYAIVPALRLVIKNQGDSSSMASAELNGAIMEVMLSTIGELCNLRYERWNLSKKAIPTILWVLIVMSAMLMFFGVMLMQSGWYNVDFWMCALTVSSIGLLIYCLADVDQTHTGFMRIPVERLDQLDFVGRAALTGDGEHANNENLGLRMAKSLAKNLTMNNKSAFRVVDSKFTKKRNPPRRSSMPILLGDNAVGNVSEEKGPSSLRPGMPTHSQSEKNLKSSAAATVIPAWQSGMKGSDAKAVSMGDPQDDHSPSVSSPAISSSEIEVPKVKSLMKRKSNAILLAKDVFSSHGKGEIDVAALIKTSSRAAW